MCCTQARTSSTTTAPISIENRERERKSERDREELVPTKDVSDQCCYREISLFFLSLRIVLHWISIDVEHYFSSQLNYENASGNQICFVSSFLSFDRFEIISNDFDTIMERDSLVNMCQKKKTITLDEKKIYYISMMMCRFQTTCFAFSSSLLTSNKDRTRERESWSESNVCAYCLKANSCSQ